MIPSFPSNLRPLPDAKFIDYAGQANFDEHSHEEIQITLFAAGSTVEHVNGITRTIRSLDFVVKPAGLPHQDVFSAMGARTVQISLAPRVLNAIRNRPELLTYCTRFDPVIIQIFMKSCEGNQFQLPLLLERLEKTCHQSDTTSMVSRTEGRSMPAWLSDVWQLIESEFVSNLTISKIANGVERHPVTVSRLFRQRFGCSIHQRIRQLRIQYAADLLCVTTQSALRIALECGFFDQSHFNRDFKRLTGATPNQFRQLILR